MIAAWPGVGNVAMLLANYMLDKLDSKIWQKLTPASFSIHRCAG